MDTKIPKKPSAFIKKFPFLSDYRRYLANRDGFFTVEKHESYLLQHKGLAEYVNHFTHLLTVLKFYKDEKGSKNLEVRRKIRLTLETSAVKMGFENWNEYCISWAKKSGYNSWYEYSLKKLKSRGIISVSEHKKTLAKKYGFNTVGEYERFLADKRKKKVVNQIVSNIIMNRLTHLHRSAGWLARQTGISKSLMYLYSTGVNVPKKERLMLIFQTLGVLDEEEVVKLLRNR